MQQPLIEEVSGQTKNQPSQNFEYSPNLVAQTEAEAWQALQKLQHTLPNMGLSNIQLTVLLQSFQGRTYGQMAHSTSYDPDYLKDVGHKLWKRLSEALGKPVTKKNLSSALRQYFQDHQKSVTLSQSANLSVSSAKLKPVEKTEVDLYRGEVPDVPVFMGRSDELGQLKQWIVEDHFCLVGLFGLGGIGKTALSAKCVEQVRQQFDCVIWRSLRNQPDYDSFITGLLQCLPGQNVTALSETPASKTSLLVQSLNQHRCLLVIDDWFNVLRSNTRAGLHQEKHDYYGLLLRRLSECRHQSCVLITSREKPVGLAFKENPPLPVRALQIQGLNKEIGREVLRGFGLSEPDANLEELVESYSGNPYALRIAAKTIIDLFGGRISKFLERNELIYGDIRRILAQQINRLTEAEKHVMHCLANHTDWASLSAIEQTLAQTTNHKTLLLEVIESLDHRNFIEKKDGKVRLPRLLKEYLLVEKKDVTLKMLD